MDNLPNKINYKNKDEYKNAYVICKIKWKDWASRYGLRKLNHIWVKYSGILGYDVSYWQGIGSIITNLGNTMNATVEIFNLHLKLNKTNPVSGNKLQNAINYIFDNTLAVNSLYDTIDRTNINNYYGTLKASSANLKKIKTSMPNYKKDYQTFINNIIPKPINIGISTNITDEYDKIILLIGNISQQFNREIKIYNDLQKMKHEYDNRPNPTTNNIDTFKTK